METTLCDKVCEWLATDRCFFPGTPASFTNKTDSNDITETLSTLALDFITIYPRISLPTKTHVVKTVELDCAGKVCLVKDHQLPPYQQTVHHYKLLQPLSAAASCLLRACDMVLPQPRDNCLHCDLRASSSSVS